MKKKTGQGEEGFVLVWALLLIVVLMLLGTFGISTSIFESKMAVNDALHKQAFYQADGGTEVGLDLLRHNINCISGFQTASFPTTGGDGGLTMLAGRENFWISNYSAGTTAASDANRDFYYPQDAPAPHTNIRINKMPLGSGAAGSTIGLSGYGALGTSHAQNVASFPVYNINAQYTGERNTESAICTDFRVDAQFANSPAGACVY